VAVLGLIENINEKVDSERLVKAVRDRPILYVSKTILQGCRQEGDMWRAVAAELEVTGRCSFSIH